MADEPTCPIDQLAERETNEVLFGHPVFGPRWWGTLTPAHIEGVWTGRRRPQEPRNSRRARDDEVPTWPRDVDRPL